MTWLALLVLFGEGWQGPLNVMVTLALPPDIKSFAISLFLALSQLIGPSGTVLYGIYLTVSVPPTALDRPHVVKHVSMQCCFDLSIHIFCHELLTSIHILCLVTKLKLGGTVISSSDASA